MPGRREQLTLRFFLSVAEPEIRPRRNGIVSFIGFLAAEAGVRPPLPFYAVCRQRPSVSSPDV